MMEQHESKRMDERVSVFSFLVDSVEYAEWQMHQKKPQIQDQKEENVGTVIWLGTKYFKK